MKIKVQQQRQDIRKDVPGFPALVGVALALAGSSALLKAENFIVSTSGEWLSASDVSLLDMDWTLRRRTLERDISASIGWAPIEMDYVPSAASLIGTPADLDDARTSFQFTWREALEETWRWNFSAGGYDGFTDYRSLWLEEYYRQLFSGIPGYREADLGGMNASIGGTYEYLPQCGMINWNVAFQSDDVSPAYEKLIGGPLVRGIDHYETWRFGLGSEHVLSPKVRFKQDAALYHTTERDLRGVYRGETAWAMTDEWSLRSSMEGSLEGDFHSAAASLMVERDWNAKWFLGLQVRAYRDNGQVIDPKLVSSSSPPLDSLQLQLALRHESEHLVWRLAVGPYLTRYGAIGVANRTFDTLYSDRDWLSMQAACTWRF
jgi:hypothetical protein